VRHDCLFSSQPVSNSFAQVPDLKADSDVSEANCTRQLPPAQARKTKFHTRQNGAFNNNTQLRQISPQRRSQHLVAGKRRTAAYRSNKTSTLSPSGQNFAKITANSLHSGPVWQVDRPNNPGNALDFG